VKGPARIVCIAVGGAATAVAITLMAMPLLDPFWVQRDIRPGGMITAVGHYALVAVASISLVLLPAAIFTDWLRPDRARLLAIVQATVGTLIALPFITHGRVVSPAPLVLGTIILIASLSAAIIGFVTKDTISNG
jgi:hypothetical protein